MKRRSKLIMACAVTITLVIIYSVMFYYSTEDNGSSDGAEFIQVFATPRDDVVQILWTYKGHDYSIKRDSKSSDWYCPDRSDVLINQNEASTMLACVYSVIADSDFNPSGNSLDEYGLETPEVSVTITLTDGSLHSFGMGSYNSFSSSYYMSYSGSDNIYLTSDPMTSKFSHTIDDITTSENE